MDHRGSFRKVMSTKERYAYVSCREDVSPSLRVMDRKYLSMICDTQKLFSSVKIRWHRGISVLKRYAFMGGFFLSQGVILCSNNYDGTPQIYFKKQKNLEELTMIENAIKKLTENNDLSFDETNKVIDEIMSGKTSAIQIASFLTALSVKKETVAEIAGAASAMRSHALTFQADEPVLEIVGTGGDHSNSFNISTTSALVVAASGIPVAKHGNRAASSKSGAADVLESLGVKIQLDPKESEAILNKIGICFLFAQEYHKAMKYVAPVRSELGIRTLFNVLGPLANPAHASQQVLGVYSEELVEPMAQVLQQIGVQDAAVIHGQDGFDEASISDATTIMEIHQGEFTKYELTPEQLGLPRANKSDIIGGTPEENAQITLDVLTGQLGPKRDVIILNSAIAIHTARPNIGLPTAVKMATETIDNGSALNRLQSFIKLTQAGVAA